MIAPCILETAYTSYEQRSITELCYKFDRTARPVVATGHVQYRQSERFDLSWPVPTNDENHPDSDSTNDVTLPRLYLSTSRTSAVGALKQTLNAPSPRVASLGPLRRFGCISRAREPLLSETSSLPGIIHYNQGTDDDFILSALRTSICSKQLSRHSSPV